MMDQGNVMSCPPCLAGLSEPVGIERSALLRSHFLAPAFGPGFARPRHGNGINIDLQRCTDCKKAYARFTDLPSPYRR